VKTHTSGFTLWINSVESKGHSVSGPSFLAERFRAKGWLVETFDTEPLARDAYAEGSAVLGQSLGLALTRLNRNGIVCVVFGGRAQPDQILWGKNRPVHLLHLWCGDIHGTVPTLALRPEAFRGGATSNGDPEGFILAELERRNWLSSLEKEEGEDDPTLLPRLRQSGLL